MYDNSRGIHDGKEKIEISGKARSEGRKIS